MHLTCTSWLLGVLASESERTQHWEGGLAHWFPPRCHFARVSHHPLSWEPPKDDIKTCSLPSCDGKSPDYTWVLSSLLG